ncbi:unnamed protein product [Discula destructiva]
MTTSEPTILIIGAGTFGVSTAYHLAQTYADPSRIILIDREPSPPTAAAAIDTSRIIRADYASPVYCALANEALHAWFWTPELGPCFHRVGRLLLDEAGSTLTHRVFDTLRARGTHIMQDVPLLDDGGGCQVALPRRWNGVLASTDTRGFGRAYFNPDAGWADAANATRRFLDTAVRKGVQRVVGDVVELLLGGGGGEEDGAGRVVGARMADGRVLRADKVVVAAGAWTSALVAPVEAAVGVVRGGERVERQARATAVVSAYYRVGEEAVGRMVCGEMPCVIYGRAGEVVPPWRDNGLLKYTNHAARVVNTVGMGGGGGVISVPPVGRDQRRVPERLKRETRAGLTSRLLPEFGRCEPESWRMCWDSCTPTDDLLLCEHPRVGSLYIITGGSFCGYKFLPNIGKYMVNVLDGQSNGPEKDKAFGWKTEAELEAASAYEERELRDFEGVETVSRL